MISVSAFNAGVEAGLTFTGNFAAPPGQLVDYSFTYVATAGTMFDHASLSSGGFDAFGGTGDVSVGLSLYDASTNAPIGTLESTFPGPSSDVANFAALGSILVVGNVIIDGGSGGVRVGSFTNGFSLGSNPVPEPASLTMLGLGAVGMVGYARNRRKAARS
jgi:hypothetical protein